MMERVRFEIIVRLAFVGSAALLGGCASMLSGLDGKSEFTCSAPDGVSCMSVSGVSANVDRNNWPSAVRTREHEELTRDLDAPLSKNKDASKPESKSGDRASDTKSARLAYAAEPVVSPATMPTTASGTPIRVPPKELRIWLAPTEDSDGDLHDQRYIYVVVHDGRWMLDATRLNSRDKYLRFQPLGSADAGVAATETGKQRPTTPTRPQQPVQPVQSQPAP